MAADLVLYQYASNNSDDVLSGYRCSDVSNLKIGDTQIALQGNNSEQR